jgi:hypothetical protein
VFVFVFCRISTYMYVLPASLSVVHLFPEVGKKTFYFKSANRKIANAWVHSAIANTQISKACESAILKSANFYFSPQIRKFIQHTAQLYFQTVQ